MAGANGIAAGVRLAPVMIRRVKPSAAIVAGLELSAVSLLLLTQVGAGVLIVLVLAVAVTGG